MKKKSLRTAAVSYTICFILLVVLIEATWGLAGGVLIGASMGTDKATQEEISSILKERGIKEPDASSTPDDPDWYDKLPPDVKKDIQNVVKKKLTAINWFGVTLSISAFVFAVAGFLCGFLNRAFFPVGLLVLLSFLVNNPVVRFPYAKALDSQQKVLIVLAQFVVCYLVGYLGASLGRKRDKKQLEISASGS